MKRKLVKQGNGALTITLPYQWIEKNGVSKGSYIDLIESGRDLLLSSEGSFESKEYKITLSNDRPFFKRYVRSCYVLGYDSLLIESTSILQYDIIKEALSTLIGYEITEQSSKRCTISVVAVPDSSNIDTIIKRLFFMVESMFSDIIEGLQSKEKSYFDAAIEAEKSTNTFVDFCLRMLNKKGYVDYKKTPYIYHILNILEITADSLRDFSKHHSSDDKKLIKLSKNIMLHYKNLFQLFYNYDMKKISSVKQERIKLLSETREVSKQFNEAIDLYMIMNLLHQLEVALDPLNN